MWWFYQQGDEFVNLMYVISIIDKYRDKIEDHNKSIYVRLKESKQRGFRALTDLSQHIKKENKLPAFTEDTKAFANLVQAVLGKSFDFKLDKTQFSVSFDERKLEELLSILGHYIKDIPHSETKFEVSVEETTDLIQLSPSDKIKEVETLLDTLEFSVEDYVHLQKLTIDKILNLI